MFTGPDGQLFIVMCQVVVHDDADELFLHRGRAETVVAWRLVDVSSVHAKRVEYKISYSIFYFPPKLTSKRTLFLLYSFVFIIC